MELNLSVPIAYLTHFNSTSGFAHELLVNTLYILNPWCILIETFQTKKVVY